MKSKFLLALLPAVWLCCPTTFIHAQSPDGAVRPTSAQSEPVTASAHATGRIAGVLKDPSGAVIQGARIEVRNLPSGFSKSLATKLDGSFAFDELPVGLYQVTLTAHGFDIAVLRDLAVTAGPATAVNVALKIAGVATIVEVTSVNEVGAEAMTSKNIGTSDTASLFDEVPGLSLATNGGLSSLPAIHGLADDRVKVLVDGMSLAPHCSNHMNPPLSYIDPGNVGSYVDWIGFALRRHSNLSIQNAMGFGYLGWLQRVSGQGRASKRIGDGSERPENSRNEPSS